MSKKILLILAGISATIALILIVVAFVSHLKMADILVPLSIINIGVLIIVRMWWR